MWAAGVCGSSDGRAVAGGFAGAVQHVAAAERWHRGQRLHRQRSARYSEEWRCVAVQLGRASVHSRRTTTLERRPGWAWRGPACLAEPGRLDVWGSEWCVLVLHPYLFRSNWTPTVLPSRVTCHLRTTRGRGWYVRTRQARPLLASVSVFFELRSSIPEVPNSR